MFNLWTWLPGGPECFKATGLELALGPHSGEPRLGLVYLPLQNGWELVIESAELYRAIDTRNNERRFAICTHGEKITRGNNRLYPHIEIYNDATAIWYYGFVAR